MEELTAKLVELIEKGEAATEAYVPVLTAHWVDYIMLSSIIGVLAGAALMVAAFFAARWSFVSFKKASQIHNGDEIGYILGGVGLILGAIIGGILGFSFIATDLPVALEPVGYLVHKFAT